jgi:hypothetical protein
MKISESDLAISVKNRVVRNFIITQTTSGKYQITVDLTWRKEQLTLVTARKTVREWVSLDRLVAHIQDNYGNPPPITLKLCDIEELNT